MSSSITNTLLSTDSTAASSKPELNSILSQVQNLQTDREKLMRELEFAKQKVEKLTEGKRVEMKQCLDTVIAKWLEESVENEANRTNFKQGLERLVKDTAEDSGVWQVVVCASAAHARRATEMEKLRLEYEQLKSKASGDFGSEASRKRSREESGGGAIPGVGESEGRGGEDKSDFWFGFEDSMRGKSFEPVFRDDRRTTFDSAL
jgi:chromosome segregation ATPase